MIKLSDFNKIILDGFGTIFDENMHPLKGAEDFIRENHKKIILLSNVGSITGDILKTKLKNSFNIVPKKVITSLDLTISYLKNKSIITFSHYGGSKTEEILKKHFQILQLDKDESDLLVMTSLPDQFFIKNTQKALNFFCHNNKSIILANPDRITIDPPYKITVGMIFDMLNNQAKSCKKDISIKEIGKPNVKLSELNIANEKKVLVIGDNPDTDIKLSANLNCKSVLISKNPDKKLSKEYVIDSINRLNYCD